MPIGKNALKRVSNNGYSKVNTSAPDMEDSVIEPEKSEPIEKVSVKTAPKRNTAPKEKKAPVKKPETEKAISKKTEKKPETKAKPQVNAKVKPEDVTHPDGFLRYGLGEELPAHLL